MASIISKGEKDMISGLPDEILVNILSFLPLEDAIKTTLLLKRFRNLWCSFPRLNLDTMETWCLKWCDYSPSYNEKFAKLILHVLIFHERMKIDELCLKHYFFFKYSKDPDYATNPNPELQIRIMEETRFANIIDSLVSFSIIKRCKVLVLDFIDTGDRGLQQSYILPAIVYRSIYLTQLSLDGCDITSCDEVRLNSLKMLHFRGVVMSDEAMEKFLLGCPLLETPSVDHCYGLHNVGCRNMKLKKLKIGHWEQKLITVSYPNTVCLNITGYCLDSVVILKSNVVDATVCFNVWIMMFFYDGRSYEGFKFLLQSLDQCKTFRLCTWSVMVFAIGELTNIPCPYYFKWKQLVLDLWLTSCVQVGLSTLLRHVPMLDTFEIHVQPRLVIPAADQSRWLQEYELDEGKHWNEAKAGLENLKIVFIHGDCIVVEPAVIHLAKFLLRNAVALEKMVISTKKNVNPNDPSYIFTSGGMKPEKDHLLTDELTCVLETLLTSPKASSNARIYFN